MKTKSFMLLFGCIVLLTASVYAGGIQVDYLRCDYMGDPLGIDNQNPTLSWTLKSDVNAQGQSAYRVVVASSLELLQQTKGDLFDSGKVISDETTAIVYAGKKLKAGHQYYWKVMVFDKSGKQSQWSNTASWTMGLMDTEWNGAWIGFDKPRVDAEAAFKKDKLKYLLVPPRFLRKEFKVKKPIVRATLYASALGNYKMSINGKPIGDDYFTPGWTDYKTRVYYNTYDVTKIVNKGPNAIGGILSDGWYSGYIGWKKNRDHYGKNPRLSAKLVLEHKDGSKTVVATDKNWQANTGPMLEAGFLPGETYDARLEMDGWNKAGFNDTSWAKADVTEKIKAKIEAYPSNTVKVFQELKPISVKEPKPGNFVFDMGTNFAGIARLKVQAPKGTKITLIFGERLNADGTVYTKNLRAARVIDTYICKGGGVETWQPTFTFHGFQYVGMTGFPGKPTADAITGLELTSATPVTGSFECSDPRLNQLYHNICQTQRANFIDLPTDCPQRDERMGWTGDAQAYIRTAGLNTDVQSFFRKWLVDLTDSQLADGDFPKVAPMVLARGSGGPAWADAAIICPWAIYEIYGDKVILEKHYDAMAKFVDYRVKAAVDNLAPKKFHCYGDWLNIKANTPKEVIYTAYSAGDAQIMAKVAAVLGKDGDVKKFNKIYEDFKAAFNKAYVGPNGIIKGNTQTAYILALWFDLVDGKMKQKAEQYLVERIKQRNWHLSTGFVGTRDLMHVLTKIGRTDVAYRLLFTDTYPSWLFPVKNGATSIWERWNSWTPEKGFGSVGMNSFSHYTYGAVGQWMFENVGGIRSVGPGYKHIEIAPKPTDKLSYARVSYNSIRGQIKSQWKLTDGNFEMTVTIPVNTTATIHVPDGGKSSRSDGARFIKIKNGAAIYEVPSGTYNFTAKLKK
ncbi:MAG: Bacterial alpha-L-rhamnosidase [Planctomycetes bacterium]|nr:Bacterial alpha-L-rhamnosidase [Planctomycetota bacterium]